MSYKPDYGLKLLQLGVTSEVDLNLFDFPLYSLSVLGEGKFSTMVELPMDGTLHALSLDFTRDQLDVILDNSKSSSVQHIKEELLFDSSIPREITIDDPIVFDVVARLGDLQSNQKESFVPLNLIGFTKDNTKQNIDVDTLKKGYVSDTRKILIEISELVSMQETAIKNHPTATQRLYQENKDVLRSSQHSSWNDYQTTSKHPLKRSDVSNINNYIVTSSFLSAWYHLKGLQENRDKATHSCVGLISGLDIPPEEIMRKYIRTEQLWRNSMQKRGITLNFFQKIFHKFSK